ncbi:hypothetical protein [Flavobacterium pectinovorum]|uniref:Lipoprotein n=1 Tax=Flavobacterium pectinovorum TaxID=29533 RepID=A0AB36P5Q6_9FLAO|nr:hypothetical protein [Flavobacterium pectinovorum]OXB06803.1 hypothetical protein B0A72_04840 [Flavobacterium pectinovorum]SHL46926.1 hypothetical protein SAMN05444387_0680 [Flavobacterium pectinovorum]
MTKKIFYLVFLAIFISGCNDKNVSDLKKNYEYKSKDIKELKEYFEKIVPKNYYVTIRYNSSDNINLVVYEPTNIPDKNDLLFQQWDVDFEDYEEPKDSHFNSEYDGKTKSLDVVKKKLNWSNNTFTELYEKLENVNSMGISSGKPIKIEYGFRGMGVLSYLFFDHNLSKTEQKENSNNCSQMFYKENIVFTFSSGAIGSFCIPDFEKNSNKK